jgi:hypothetical protein
VTTGACVLEKDYPTTPSTQRHKSTASSYSVRWTTKVRRLRSSGDTEKRSSVFQRLLRRRIPLSLFSYDVPRLSHDVGEKCGPTWPSDLHTRLRPHFSGTTHISESGEAILDQIRARERCLQVFTSFGLPPSKLEPPPDSSPCWSRGTGTSSAGSAQVRGVSPILCDIIVMRYPLCQGQKSICASATRLSHAWPPDFRAPITCLRCITLLLVILSENALSQTGNVSGIVRASDSRSPLANCNVIVRTTSVGTTTDETGTFSIDVPLGNYVFEFSHIGYETTTRDLFLSAFAPTIHLTIDLERGIIEQDEVRVEGERETVAVSIQDLERQRIRGMPTVYSDALRSLKIVPGVTSNNELASSYNVRGGNHNENTIYLNDYEIYRPFLLRQGVEENQTLVNSDLVQNLRLYRGVFPARYAHRMSSIVEVDYTDTRSEKLAGTIRGDLFNMGASLQKDWGSFNMIGGLRWAYPELFVNKMQTRGNYRPLFADVQLLVHSDASPSSEFQLFVLSAYNKFDLTPLSWNGYFRGTSPTDIQEVEIEFTGNRS